MTCPHPKPILGLLGGPGSGKSFIAKQFAKLGCAVIDADRLARAQLETEPVAELIVSWWGESILDRSGQVDPAAVARIVFENPAELTKLENLIHPRVRAERDRQRTAYLADPAVIAIVEDVPLLLEKGWEDGCDRLIYVDAPREIRLDRVQRERGWSDEQLALREKNQWPLDMKRKRADDVVDNSRGETEALEQIRDLLSRLIPKL